MNEQSKEIITIVKEDLLDLFQDFGGDDYIDSRIRKSASTLNMLLIENNLKNAYRLMYGNLAKIKIVSPSLDLFVKYDTDNKIVNAVAGGAHLKGIHYALAITNEGKETIQLPEDINPINIELVIDKWLIGTGLIINKIPVSRQILITYIANKKGGKHLDYKRGEKRKDQLYKLLDENQNTLVFDDKKNAIYLELHAIIQCLMNSPDIRKFLNKDIPN
jgi:hypothetical protein